MSLSSATDAPDRAPATPRDISALVSAELDRILAAQERQAAQYGTTYVSLWQRARSSALGGKLLRPRLLVDTYLALTAYAPSAPVTDLTAAIRLAATAELLHYAFLLHDDVIDGDLTRRGRPNLMGGILQDCAAISAGASSTPQHTRAPRDRHWADTNGILLGDLFLSLAHQRVAREALPEHARLRLLDLLDHTITESVVGEQLDVALSAGVIPAHWDTVLRMSQLKTATYTFEFPLRAAAILAGAPPEIDDQLCTLGRSLGLAFQLQDDLLSTFGHASEHGKDAYSDLREGKETAVIAYARGTEAWAHIAPIFGSPSLRSTEYLRIREHLRSSGAERAVSELIASQIDRCHEICAQSAPTLPAPFTEYIAGLVSELQGRCS